MTEINHRYTREGNPARDFREMIYSPWKYKIGNLSDEQFREFLQTELEKEKLEIRKWHDLHPNVPIGRNTALFQMSIGLLTYGHIEMFNEIIDNIPTKGNMRGLSSIILEMFPVPEGLHPWHHAEEIKRWFEEHKDKLKWDETRERFTLE